MDGPLQSKLPALASGKTSPNVYQNMQEIHTNNLVESWHNILKSVYLRSARKQRPDLLVYKLLREALMDLRLKVANVLNGFGRRQMCQAEIDQLNKCNAIADEDAQQYIFNYPSSVESDVELEKMIQIKSLTKKGVYYSVSLNASSSISSCTCPYMTKKRIACKHMHMVKRLLGYTICYDSGDHDKAFESSVLPNNPLPGLAREGFGHDSGSNLTTFVQQISTSVSNYDTMAPDEKELIVSFQETYTAFQSSKKRSGKSLTQKQK